MECDRKPFGSRLAVMEESQGFKKPKKPFSMFVEKNDKPLGSVSKHKINVVIAIPMLIISERTMGSIPTSLSSRVAVMYEAPPMAPNKAIIAPRLSFSCSLSSSLSPPLVAQMIAPTSEMVAPSIVILPGVSTPQLIMA